MRRLVSPLFSPLAAVVLSVSWFGCDVAGEGEGEGPSPDLDATVRLTGPTLTPVFGFDLSCIAATADGFAVAAFAGDGVVVTRLRNDLTPLWAAKFAVRGAPTDVLVDGEDVIVLAGQTGTPVHIARYDEEGSLVSLIEEEAAATRGFVDDGDLVLLNGGAVKRYAPDFTPRWQKNYAAVDMVKDGDDYLLVGTPIRIGGTMTGIEVTRVSAADGAFQWRSFQSPGPGNHSIAGIGVVGGAVVVGMGNDSTGASAATLSPLVVARFDKDSGAPLDMKKLRLDIDTDGALVPLQFGRGLAADVSSGTFFVGLIATSGGLGANVQTSIIVNAADATAINVGGAFARADDGAFVSVRALADGWRVARASSTARDSACNTPLGGGSFDPITAQTEQSDDGANVIDVDVPTATSLDVSGVVELIATAECPAP